MSKIVTKRSQDVFMAIASRLYYLLDSRVASRVTYKEHEPDEGGLEGMDG